MEGDSSFYDQYNDQTQDGGLFFSFLEVAEPKNPFTYFMGGLMALIFFISVVLSHIATKRAASPVMALSRPPKGVYVHEYWVILKTSLWPSSSLTKRSVVKIQLFGTFRNSPVFQLHQEDITRRILCTGSTDIFVVSTTEDLGDVCELYVTLVNWSDKGHCSWRPCFFEVIKCRTGERWGANFRGELLSDTWTDAIVPLFSDEREETGFWKLLLSSHPFTSCLGGQRSGAYTYRSHVIYVFFYMSCLLLATLTAYRLGPRFHKHKLETGFPTQELVYGGAAALSAAVVISLIEVILHNTAPVGLKTKAFSGLYKQRETPRTSFSFYVDCDWDLLETLPCPTPLKKRSDPVPWNDPFSRIDHISSYAKRAYENYFARVSTRFRLRRRYDNPFDLTRQGSSESALEARMEEQSERETKRVMQWRQFRRGQDDDDDDDDDEDDDDETEEEMRRRSAWRKTTRKTTRKMTRKTTRKVTIMQTEHFGNRHAGKHLLGAPMGHAYSMAHWSSRLSRGQLLVQWNERVIPYGKSRVRERRFRCEKVKLDIEKWISFLNPHSLNTHVSADKSVVAGGVLSSEAKVLSKIAIDKRLIQECIAVMENELKAVSAPRTSAVGAGLQDPEQNARAKPFFVRGRGVIDVEVSRREDKGPRPPCQFCLWLKDLPVRGDNLPEYCISLTKNVAEYLGAASMCGDRDLAKRVLTMCLHQWAASLCSRMLVEVLKLMDEGGMYTRDLLLPTEMLMYSESNLWYTQIGFMNARRPTMPLHTPKRAHTGQWRRVSFSSNIFFALMNRLAGASFKNDDDEDDEEEEEEDSTTPSRDRRTVFKKQQDHSNSAWNPSASVSHQHETFRTLPASASVTQNTFANRNFHRPETPQSTTDFTLLSEDNSLLCSHCRDSLANRDSVAEIPRGHCGDDVTEVSLSLATGSQISSAVFESGLSSTNQSSSRPTETSFSLQTSSIFDSGQSQTDLSRMRSTQAVLACPESKSDLPLHAVYIPVENEPGTYCAVSVDAIDSGPSASASYGEATSLHKEAPSYNAILALYESASLYTDKSTSVIKRQIASLNSANAPFTIRWEGPSSGDTDTSSTLQSVPLYNATLPYAIPCKKKCLNWLMAARSHVSSETDLCSFALPSGIPTMPSNTEMSSSVGISSGSGITPRQTQKKQEIDLSSFTMPSASNIEIPSSIDMPSTSVITSSEIRENEDEEINTCSSAGEAGRDCETGEMNTCSSAGGQDKTSRFDPLSQGVTNYQHSQQQKVAGDVVAAMSRIRKTITAVSKEAPGSPAISLAASPAHSRTASTADGSTSGNIMKRVRAMTRFDTMFSKEGALGRFVNLLNAPASKSTSLDAGPLNTNVIAAMCDTFTNCAGRVMFQVKYNLGKGYTCCCCRDVLCQNYAVFYSQFSPHITTILTAALPTVQEGLNAGGLNRESVIKIAREMEQAFEREAFLYLKVRYNALTLLGIGKSDKNCLDEIKRKLAAKKTTVPDKGELQHVHSRKRTFKYTAKTSSEREEMIRILDKARDTAEEFGYKALAGSSADRRDWRRQLNIFGGPAQKTATKRRYWDSLLGDYMPAWGQNIKSKDMRLIDLPVPAGQEREFSFYPWMKDPFGMDWLLPRYFFSRPILPGLPIPWTKWKDKRGWAGSDADDGSIDVMLGADVIANTVIQRAVRELERELAWLSGLKLVLAKCVAMAKEEVAADMNDAMQVALTRLSRSVLVSIFEVVLGDREVLEGRKRPTADEIRVKRLKRGKSSKDKAKSKEKARRKKKEREKKKINWDMLFLQDVIDGLCERWKIVSAERSYRESISALTRCVSLDNLVSWSEATGEERTKRYLPVLMLDSLTHLLFVKRELEEALGVAAAEVLVHVIPFCQNVMKTMGRKLSTHGKRVDYYIELVCALEYLLSNKVWRRVNSAASETIRQMILELASWREEMQIEEDRALLLAAQNQLLDSDSDSDSDDTEAPSVEDVCDEITMVMEVVYRAREFIGIKHATDICKYIFSIHKLQGQLVFHAFQELADEHRCGDDHDEDFQREDLDAVEWYVMRETEKSLSGACMIWLERFMFLGTSVALFLFAMLGSSLKTESVQWWFSIHCITLLVCTFVFEPLKVLLFKLYCRRKGSRNGRPKKGK